MTLPGRKVSIHFRRNEGKDEQLGGIEYTGYDLYWPSGRKIQGMAFDRFCKIGMRYILGRDKPEFAAVDAYFLPLASREDVLPRVPGCRLRVLYFERTGTQLKVFLSDDTPTEIIFDLERDEEPLLAWLGGRGVADGDRQWFGFYAVRKDAAAVTVPARRGTGRTAAWAGHAAPTRRGSPTINGESEGMFLAP